MREVKFKFDDSPYEFKMFIDENRIIGDIIPAEDCLRYIIWDCEIMNIDGEFILLKKLHPNELWYRMVLETHG